jgi:hypothetical protein
LPKKRKGKDDLSENIPISNIATTYTVKREISKKKEVTVSLETHYNAIGLVDNCRTSKIS